MSARSERRRKGAQPSLMLTDEQREALYLPLTHSRLSIDGCDELCDLLATVVEAIVSEALAARETEWQEVARRVLMDYGDLCDLGQLRAIARGDQ